MCNWYKSINIIFFWFTKIELINLEFHEQINFYFIWHLQFTDESQGYLSHVLKYPLLNIFFLLTLGWPVYYSITKEALHVIW